MFTVDRSSTLSLADQIVQQFIAATRQGVLLPGTRLPSIRKFAEMVGVSPYTAVNAYDRLVALGHVVHQASSGFFVSLAQAKGTPFMRERVGADGDLDAIWLARSVPEMDGDWVPAGSGQLPGQWLEDVGFNHILHRIARDQRADAFRSSPVQGLLALREALSGYLVQEKIHVEPGNIVTTVGATQALDLICRAMLRRGDTVVVENPTYPLLLSRLKMDGVNVIGINRSPDGLDAAALERLCEVQVPKIVFTQSALHNPTGWNSSTQNVFRVLSLADRYRFTIAEDDTYGDLASGNPPRFAHLSALDHVLYYRSFTKAMGSFVRVGFVAAKPDTLDALVAAKIHSVSTSSGIDERIMLALLQGGRYRKHTERLAQRLAAGRINTIKALNRSGLQFAAEGEGMFLWAKVPGNVDMSQLVRDAYANKILLAPGGMFACDDYKSDDGSASFQSFLRLNVSASNHMRLANFLSDRIGLPKFQPESHVRTMEVASSC
jgi:DNA-binding transcriptional MocR family regulator